MVKASKSHGRLAIQPNLKPTELLHDTPDILGAWKAKIITLFPEIFPGSLASSLTGKALQEGLWQLETIELRGFGIGKHKNVDAPPAGGGAGLVLKADVIGSAMEEARRGTPIDPKVWPVIYMSPRGKPLTQKMAYEFSKAQGITILCGRFEGVDERVLEEYDIQEVSIGDFILTGGEIAAQALIDATVRLIPRVLGNAESILEETFSNGLLEHPQYTRPKDWKGRMIPEILLSGHHANVAKWRTEQSKALTQKRRPDLWRAYENRDPNEDQEP